MSGSRRQDYISRVRYQNDLPPPPCAPKLLKMPYDIKNIASSALLSNMVRKQPLNVDIDLDLGMPIDLLEVPGAFDRESEMPPSVLSEPPFPDKLDPLDQYLLKPPSTGEGATIHKSRPEVSFLRRTEYNSAEPSNKAAVLALKKAAEEASKAKNAKVDPEAIVKNIEASFDAANEDISTLKHPKRKHVHAVESWPLLPNFELLDQSYVMVRLMGSASLKNQAQKEAISEPKLNTALFRPVTLDSDEWISAYFMDDDADASELRQQLDNPSQIVDDISKVYPYKKFKDYDLSYVANQNSMEQIAVNFADGVATFLPIYGRSLLQRRRLQPHQLAAIADDDFGKVDLTLREITAEESIERYNDLSEYDPIAFVKTEIAEEARDEEGEQDEDTEEN